MPGRSGSYVITGKSSSVRRVHVREGLLKLLDIFLISRNYRVKVQRVIRLSKASHAYEYNCSLVRNYTGRLKGKPKALNIDNSMLVRATRLKIAIERKMTKAKYKYVQYRAKLYCNNKQRIKIKNRIFVHHRWINIRTRIQLKRNLIA